MHLKAFAIVLLGSGLGLFSSLGYAQKTVAIVPPKQVVSNEFSLKLAVFSQYINPRVKGPNAIFYLQDRTPSGSKDVKKLAVQASQLFPSARIFDDVHDEELGKLFKSGAQLIEITILDLKWDSKVKVDVYTRIVEGSSANMVLKLKKIKGKWKVIYTHTTAFS